jgi:hypothetical protein
VEVFEHAAAAGGQLLQVERLAPAAGSGEDAAALVLTFDVGRILLSLDPGTARLVATHLATSGDVPGGALSANEEEPWWRLLGAALARATASEDASRLRLEFRIAGAAPRTLALVSDGIRLRASIEDDG